LPLDVRELLFDGLTADPSSPPDGLIWYRSDTGIWRLRSAGDSVQINAVKGGSIVRTTDDSTSSTSPVDAFNGDTVTGLPNGTYLAIFECVVAGGTNDVEIGIGENSTSSFLGSTRTIDGSERNAGMISKIITGVTVGKDYSGLFAKAGGGGSVTISNRRLTMFRLSR
jgi:hypothetical protein